ncbi:hypothetical protein [Nocardiopsis ansamitocini]|uniref:Uncharacterized protein n=1 Tax=Nocardiopsis ansamitocini TaxID=1670832 RepID=A0A9W6UHL5_9ACTN|nr:hypothetical protein [Nocardiopsis ansamitocini]GLU48991.1 hypothetical protein Nans01_33420 [Nocardiopsis ansamitocini]
MPLLQQNAESTARGVLVHQRPRERPGDPSLEPSGPASADVPVTIVETQAARPWWTWPIPGLRNPPTSVL